MNIYLAGAIERNDWRSTIVQGMDRVSGTPDYWPILEKSIFGLYSYVGPYCVEDHLTFHGSSESFLHAEVQKACLRAVAAANIVFAWIDRWDTYGTLVELGYGAAHQKGIYIASPPDFLEYKTDETRDGPDGDAEPIYACPAKGVYSFDDLFANWRERPGHDLWFAYRLARKIVVANDPCTALTMLVSQLAVYRVVDASRKSRCRTCGEPLVWGKSKYDRWVPLDARTLVQDGDVATAQLHAAVSPRCRNQGGA